MDSSGRQAEVALHAVVADVGVLGRAHRLVAPRRRHPPEALHAAARPACVRPRSPRPPGDRCGSPSPPARAASARGCRAAACRCSSARSARCRSLPCASLRTSTGLPSASCRRSRWTRPLADDVFLAARGRGAHRGGHDTACDPRCSSPPAAFPAAGGGGSSSFATGDSPLTVCGLRLLPAPCIVEAEALERLRARVLRHRHQRERHRLRAVPLATRQLRRDVVEQRRPSRRRGPAVSCPCSTTARSRSSEPKVYGFASVNTNACTLPPLSASDLRHFGLARELIGGGQHPAFAQRIELRFAQPVHRADLRRPASASVYRRYACA